MYLDALPRIRIFMEPSNLEVLQKNVWNEEPLPSNLIIDNHTYETGITYRGDHTRNFPKKSFRLEFRGYNEEFEGREVHLNAEYRDPSLIRNKLSLDFFKTIGSISPDSRYVYLELNEEPMGVYLQLESVDDLFLKKRQLMEGPIYYAAKYHANFSLLTPKRNPKRSLLSGYIRKLGNDEDNLDLEIFIGKVNTVPRSEFSEVISTSLDIDKYLLWLCGVVCTQNYDGFIHNYALYRNGKTGKYQMIPWDYDATFGRNWNGKKMNYDYVPIHGYNTLTARLLDIKSIREQYRLLLEEILETSFTVDALEPRIAALHQQLRPYVEMDPYKKDSIDMFDSEPEFILRFISDRNAYLRSHLQDLKEGN